MFKASLVEAVVRKRRMPVGVPTSEPTGGHQKWRRATSWKRRPSRFGGLGKQLTGIVWPGKRCNKNLYVGGVGGSFGHCEAVLANTSLQCLVHEWQEDKSGRWTSGLGQHLWKCSTCYNEERAEPQGKVVRRQLVTELHCVLAALVWVNCGF